MKRPVLSPNARAQYTELQGGPINKRDRHTEITRNLFRGRGRCTARPLSFRFRRRGLERLRGVSATTLPDVTSFVFLVHSLVLALFRRGTVLPPFSKNLGNLPKVGTWELLNHLGASFYSKEHVCAERLLRSIFAALFPRRRLCFLFLRRRFLGLLVFQTLAFSFCLGRIKFSLMIGPNFRMSWKYWNNIGVDTLPAALIQSCNCIVSGN